MKTLKLRKVAIDTYKENVAYLHRKCPLYRSEGFQALNKIEISNGINSTAVIAVLNIVDDDNIIATDELGLSEQTYAQFKEVENSLVQIHHALPASSIPLVHAKIAGNTLSKNDFLSICEDIVNNRYSKIEITAFLVACAEGGLERDEILYLTEAMVETGQCLNWGEPMVVDKHCIGGIPGNRTTMLIVPIIAAHGMLMPKTSSRAITSPSGTADTMEVLARVNLEQDELYAIARQQRGVIAWGGTANLAPVDDILISVERPLALDSQGQMIASILSKKIAAGASHLLVDIPVGPTAKMKTHTEALKLRKLFEYIGDHTELQLEVIITDGRQPIGNGVGPALEARDIMQVLQNNPRAPMDLKEKALQLAGRILEFDPDIRGGQGYFLARDLLESGRALQKMQDIMAHQGNNDSHHKKPQFHVQVVSPKSGYVTAIDNIQIAYIARMAGAPMDKLAGIDLHKKLHAAVNKNEPLYTINAEYNADFQFAKTLALKNSGYCIGENNDY